MGKTIKMEKGLKSIQAFAQPLFAWSKTFFDPAYPGGTPGNVKTRI
jgi:hypothetical protein